MMQYWVLNAWKPLVEITILWFVIYHLLLFFQNSRAVFVLRGIVIIFLSFFLFQRLSLGVLDLLMTKLLGISIIAFLIIFHPEIRQGLAKLGRRHLFGAEPKEESLQAVLKQISLAAENLSKGKIGAIIAVEKNDPLTPYIESGVLVDGRVSSELIETIFTRNSILHDGGLVIRSGRLVAAGCIFPMTEKQDLNRIFGTRHRAALGLSEETDALIIVVSEERQDISLVYSGKMLRDLSREELFSKMKEAL